MYRRIQGFKDLKKESAFLWGARQTGKSTLLKELYPESPYYDLLLSDEFQKFSSRPYLLRQELIASSHKKFVPVIIDEVQKVPHLLDEVQWLMVNKAFSFILCGSSARKLKRSSVNLLGGRALRYELYPLVSAEIPNFDLIRALNHGLLPRHYLAAQPEKLILSYISDYLKEEIAAEALVRNIPNFARFLEIAAFSNGEIVNFKNIAAECGVSGPTVKEYFQILEDTLIARFVPSYRKRPKRRVIQAPRFYFFDVAIANQLLKRGRIVAKSESFGRAFEHFIFQEIWSHSSYSGIHYPIAYWRTASQIEVDFVLGDQQVALEVKGTDFIGAHHLKGLKAFSEEYKTKELIIISLENRVREIDGITILPWKIFLERLWSNDLLR